MKEEEREGRVARCSFCKTKTGKKKIKLTFVFFFGGGEGERGGFVFFLDLFYILSRFAPAGEN